MCWYRHLGNLIPSLERFKDPGDDRNSAAVCKTSKIMWSECLLWVESGELCLECEACYDDNDYSSVRTLPWRRVQRETRCASPLKPIQLSTTRKRRALRGEARQTSVHKSHPALIRTRDSLAVWRCSCQTDCMKDVRLHHSLCRCEALMSECLTDSLLLSLISFWRSPVDWGAQVKHPSAPPS